MSHPSPFPSLTLSVDVWADVACPWCWIGERRLQEALTQRPEVRTELRWRPFLLQPDLPPEGIEWDEFIRVKFGGVDRAVGAFRQVEAAGREAGLIFDFEAMRRAPHTGDAHRVILAAAAEGRSMSVADALFRAHFARGLDLNRREDLLSAAAAGGISRERAEAVLDGSSGEQELRESREEAQRLGIRGVPFFVFGERYAVSGAHPPETLLHAIDTTLRELVLQS